MMMSQNFNTYGSGDQNIFSIKNYINNFATLWNRVYFFFCSLGFLQSDDHISGGNKICQEIKLVLNDFKMQL